MIEKVDEIMEQAVLDGVFPGATLCLLHQNRPYFRSYGKKALFPKEEENDIHTIYDMASCTKVVITTSCIMMLAEEGKIRLYDLVSLYLPEFKHKDVTIWDLLTHTSGLPSGIVGGYQLSKEDLRHAILTVDQTYPKNTQIIYSDLGFILLGWIIEKVSHQPLNEFAKEHLLDPLEMTHSGYRPTDPLLCAPTEDRGDKIDRGYVHDEMAHIFDGVAGHAGFFSCVKDIHHFMQMILNDGMYQGKRILSKQSIDLFFTTQVEEKIGISLDTNRRSIGWIVKCERSCCGDFASPETIMHTGFTGTSIVIDRKNKVGLCILSNRVHPTRQNNKIIPFRSRVANYIFAHLEDF